MKIIHNSTVTPHSRPVTRHRLAIFSRRAPGLQAAVVAALLCVAPVGSTWAQTEWINSGGGVWSDAPSWSSGVPNGNDALLSLAGVSYTVTYDAPATAFRDLIISNSASYTSTLNIASTGFASGRTNRFTRGAVVNVNAGGDWRAEYGQAGSLEVLEGASLNINGGTMLYTNLLKGFLFNLYGSGSSVTSYLNITSGRFEFGGTNDAYAGGTASPTFNLGYKAPGVINISGGTCVVQRLYGWDIGSSAGGRGYINITGGELVITGQTAATGPYCAIAAYGGYGEMNVSGSGRATLYVRQWALGYSGNSRMNVDGGTATVNGVVYIGYRGINSTGIVTVTAGQLQTSSHVYLGYPYSLGDHDDTGILNVYGGLVRIGGILVAGHTTGGQVNKIGRVTVTNGVLSVASGITVSDVTSTGTNYGELNLSGSGIISNWGNLYVGSGTNAVGIVNQAGGTFDQNYISSVTYLGDYGGNGTFNMSGGLLKNKYTVYVGGANGSNSVGALNISGGTFQAYQPLYIGQAGTGTLSMIGSEGTLAVSALAATSRTSKIRFDLGPNGAGTVTVSGVVSLGANTTLEITSSNYDWAAKGVTVDLISYGILDGKFGATNLITTGGLAGGTILYGSGISDKIRIQFNRRPSGTLFFMSRAKLLPFIVLAHLKRTIFALRYRQD